MRCGISLWLLAFAAAALCPLEGLAVPPGVSPPATAASIASDLNKIALHSHQLPWKPWSDGSMSPMTGAYGPATIFTPTSSGRTWLGVIEAPADYYAVQVVFGNQDSVTYGVQTVTVSPSATYGSSLHATGGVTPFDEFGNASTAMVPATFVNGGAPTAYGQFSGTAASPTGWQFPQTTLSGTPSNYNRIIVPLSASAAFSSGATALTFSGTASSNLFGGVLPQNGMLAYDGLGGLPANCKIGSVTVTSVINVNLVGGCSVTATGIASGQNVWFSWGSSTPPLAVTVPAATNMPATVTAYSDVIPVSSVRRTDGGMVSGMIMSGGGLAAGTVVAPGGVSPGSVQLSTPTTGTTAAGSAITFTQSHTEIASLAAGASVAIDSLTGVQINQTVTDVTNPSAIPTGTVVRGVFQNYEGRTAVVRLSNKLAGAGVVSGDVLAFSNVAYVSGSTTIPSGATSLPFMSTSTRPLLLIRATFNGTGDGAWIYYVSPTTIAWEQARGLEFEAAFNNAAGVDAANNTAAASNNAGNVGQQYRFPIYKVIFYTYAHGVQVYSVGDSHMASNETTNVNYNFVRIAANALSTPARPIAYENGAFAGKNSNTFGPYAAATIQAEHPGVVVWQGWSDNGGDSVQSYIAGMLSQLRLVDAYGGRGIIASEQLRQVRYVYSYLTAGAVTASPNIIVTNNVFANAALPSGTYLATGIGTSCIPAGTTATVTSPGNPSPISYAMTLSTSVTCPAGTAITFGVLQSGASTTSSTALTLAYPSPMTLSIGSLGVVSIPGCAATTMAVTAGSSSATLASPCSVAAGSMIQISGTNNALSLQQVEQAYGLENQIAQSGSVPFFDTMAPAEDPNDPEFYRIGLSPSGVHGTDIDQELIATAFAPILASVIGQ